MTKRKSLSGRKSLARARNVVQPWWYRLTTTLLALPRMARIAITAVVALATVLVISPIIDRLYMEHFYAPATVMLPSLLTAFVGLMMYVLGWWLIVGVAGETKQVSLASVIYLLTGIMLAVFMVLWVLRLAFFDGAVMAS